MEYGYHRGFIRYRYLIGIGFDRIRYFAQSPISNPSERGTRDFPRSGLLVEIWGARRPSFIPRRPPHRQQQFMLNLHVLLGPSG